MPEMNSSLLFAGMVIRCWRSRFGKREVCPLILASNQQKGEMNADPEAAG
ncbi:hypothetical protein KCP74_06175 [Salmonella enterica subsp. enterica]|nr:hypothetical protein KCP74_06175 [Salmonella enterica subsp. enterica]